MKLRLVGIDATDQTRKKAVLVGDGVLDVPFEISLIKRESKEKIIQHRLFTVKKRV